jgi:1-acyl-sn-glycerol-3-phosphate acyltransferase
MFDPILMAAGTRRHVRFMAKAEVFSWPIIGFLARLAGAFPVKRGDADMRAVKYSLQILAQGGVLGIFPEGTRAKEGEVKTPFQGVTMLAERTQSLIVPTAIVGSYRLWQPLTIVFGQPVNVLSLCKAGEYDRSAATARLMEIINRLKESVR